MTRAKLRNAIAREAARLLLRGTETEYFAARKRAARWLSKRKLDPADLPSNGEIRSELCELAGLFAAESEAADDEDYHPDAFPFMRLLLLRLEGVRMPPSRHPEGDALYHSLQVYEQGLSRRPYDEEFLLACLLHDAGMAIDRRNPVRSAVEALQDLVTERTCFLIEHLSQAKDYLRTGRISKSLRRSEHFDDLVLLARCDQEGRVPGAEVCDVDEALEYIAGLSTAWDDV